MSIRLSPEEALELVRKRKEEIEKEYLKEEKIEQEKFDQFKKEEGKKFDIGKLRWDLLDPDFPEGVVKILTMGCDKYGPNNWRGLIEKDGINRCYAALIRHIMAWRKGEKTDPESGHSHLYHAACNLYFLDWFEKNAK